MYVKVIVAVLVVLSAWYIMDREMGKDLQDYLLPTEIEIGSVTFNFWNSSFKFRTGNDSYLYGKFEGIVKKISSKDKTDVHISDDEHIFIEWRNLVNASFEFKADSGNDVNCTEINLNSLSSRYIPKVCFLLRDAYWFGGWELLHQTWPIKDTSVSEQAFLSNDNLLVYPDGIKDRIGPILEGYWLNSRGVAVIVKKDVPLYVSFNDSSDNKICFSSKTRNVNDLTYTEYAPEDLMITVCKGRNIREVDSYLRPKLFDFPSGIPDEWMIRSPIWSTWAQYKEDINQQKVIEFSKSIREHGFPNSHLEIDDMFSSYYGEMDFSDDKFPDVRQMIDSLHKSGYRTTVWVTPFANPDSPAFKEGTKNDYWVMDSKKNSPALVSWWRGSGALLDVTNPQAVRWYKDRLQSMKQNYGVDSFKFDAGEASFLPENSSTFQPLISRSDYCNRYVDLAASFGNLIEVRCGWGSQKHGVFFRMADRFSKWGYENGLKSVIPTMLMMGLLGYPFILPDMIGGNAYPEDGTGGEGWNQTEHFPERELLIRWTELSAYLPAMQFSIVPWHYDAEVIQIARKFVAIHQDEVATIVLEAAKQAMLNGSPLIRPLWWIAPTDQTALNIDTEFLVGDALLVAPILDNGARSRDIYLPNGLWKDRLRGFDFSGPIWLPDYRIELDEVATFVRV